MKKKLLLCISISFSLNAFCQISIQWQRSFGGGSDEQINSIIELPQIYWYWYPNLRYVTAGYTESSDGDIIWNPLLGSGDYSSLYLDSNHAFPGYGLWGGSSFEEATQIVWRPSNDKLYMAGYSESTDGQVTGNHGGPDFWILQIDVYTPGAFEWQRSLGGTYEDKATSVCISHGNGCVVSGYTLSNDGDVTGNHGYKDYWVVQLDDMGNIQWQKCLGGTYGDWAYSVQATTDGGYIVAGTTQSFDGNVTGHHSGQYNNYDCWIVKLNGTGIIQWQKCLGGAYNEGANAIIQTSDGGYIIAGNSNSNNADVSGNHGGYDYWVAKLDNTGNIQWQKSLGGTSTDIATSIKQIADGSYIVAGK